MVGRGRGPGGWRRTWRTSTRCDSGLTVLYVPYSLSCMCHIDCLICANTPAQRSRFGRMFDRTANAAQVGAQGSVFCEI